MATIQTDGHDYLLFMASKCVLTTVFLTSGSGLVLNVAYGLDYSYRFGRVHGLFEPPCF